MRLNDPRQGLMSGMIECDEAECCEDVELDRGLIAIINGCPHIGARGVLTRLDSFRVAGRELSTEPEQAR